MTNLANVVSDRYCEIEVLVETGVEDLVQFGDHRFELPFPVAERPDDAHVEGSLLKY